MHPGKQTVSIQSRQRGWHADFNIQRLFIDCETTLLYNFLSKNMLDSSKVGLNYLNVCNFNLYFSMHAHYTILFKIKKSDRKIFLRTS
jgi:hypothetical protein